MVTRGKNGGKALSLVCAAALAFAVAVPFGLASGAVGGESAYADEELVSVGDSVAVAATAGAKDEGENLAGSDGESGDPEASGSEEGGSGLGVGGAGSGDETEAGSPGTSEGEAGGDEGGGGGETIGDEGEEPDPGTKPGPDFVPVSRIDLGWLQTVSLEAGESIGLYFTVEPKNATDKRVAFSSSDESVATVDGEGHVIARCVGRAAITVAARDSSGVEATCLLEVSETSPFELKVIEGGRMENGLCVLDMGEEVTFEVNKEPTSWSSTSGFYMVDALDDLDLQRATFRAVKPGPWRVEATYDRGIRHDTVGIEGRVVSGEPAYALELMPRAGQAFTGSLVEVAAEVSPEGYEGFIDWKVGGTPSAALRFDEESGRRALVASDHAGAVEVTVTLADAPGAPSAACEIVFTEPPSEAVDAGGDDSGPSRVYVVENGRVLLIPTGQTDLTSPLTGQRGAKDPRIGQVRSIGAAALLVEFVLAACALRAARPKDARVEHGKKE